MSDADAWDDAVIAARSMGSSLGRVAKRFGTTIQAVLDAQERVNARRRAGEDAARAARAEAKAEAVARRAEATRSRIPKPPRPTPVRLDPADFMNLEQLAARWGVSIEKAKRHTLTHAIEAVRVLADAEEWFRRADVQRWEDESQRTYSETVGRDPL